MKKLLVLCLAMVFGVMMIAGCGSQNEQSSSGNEADNSKPIVIGLDDSYPPMGFKDENN